MSQPQTKSRPGVACPAQRKTAGKAKPTRPASQGYDHHTQGPGPRPHLTQEPENLGQETVGAGSVANPAGKGKVVPGRGGGAEGGQMGEALWLLRFSGTRLSGTTKQEGREEGTRENPRVLEVNC